MKPVFIVGCGYVGKRVAALEKARGAEVSALARSDESRQRLEAEGIGVLRGDLDLPASPPPLPLAGGILYYFAPPPTEGRSDPRIDAFLSSLAPPSLPAKVVLISTTGVYGDCQGQWVTEERPPHPETDRACRRLHAETSLAEWGVRHKVDHVILRVAGIYGPGRLPEASLRRGMPVVREEEAPFSNRIHADDLARICLAAADRGRSGEIYNVSDGHPTTMSDYFDRLADGLNFPRPERITLSEAMERFSPGMISYLKESRRLSNNKLLAALQIELLYPDLASGIRASLKD